MLSSQRFRRVERLTQSSDFERVYRTGRIFQNEHLRVHLLDRGTDGPARLGLTVTKKLGRATIRNRLRRWIREWFRTHKAQLQGLDLVIQPKPAAAQLEHKELLASLRKLGASLRLD